MRPDLVLRGSSPRNGILTLHAAGVVDAHTLDRFEAALRAAVDRGPSSLVLDCDEVRYVSSAGFGEIIRAHDRLRERGGTLVLARVPPKVAIILEMLGLKSLIPTAASLDEADDAARLGPSALPPEPPPVPARVTASIPRVSAPAPSPAPPSASRDVTCVFCDARILAEGEGRWLCPACGAPFSATLDGGVAFDWSAVEGEAVHLTMDATPRSMAALAGLLEGMLTERRVSHARMRRMSRETAHLCHVLAERACDGRRGPFHVLVQAGEDRLLVRIVDRGRALGAGAADALAGPDAPFSELRYASLASGVNVTDAVFSYEEAPEAVS